MKILVTGSYGQLGNELNQLKEDFPEWNFLLTDADSLDITSEITVQNYFQNNNPDFLINCAAYTAVDKAEIDIETAEKVNAFAPKLLAKYARESNTRVIHVSTDYVFNGTACKPYVETDTVDPKGVYGKTKLEGEHNCLSENPETIVIRTSWLYSSFGNNFVKTMLRLGKERELLNVVFDQVGTPTYAANLANAILKIIQITEKDHRKFIPGIYHYSNEGVASWYDFANAIFELSGLKCEVFPVLSNQFPTPAKRPNYSVLDKTKIKDSFAIKIPNWRESLKICIGKLIEE